MNRNKFHIPIFFKILLIISLIFFIFFQSYKQLAIHNINKYMTEQGVDTTLITDDALLFDLLKIFGFAYVYRLNSDTNYHFYYSYTLSSIHNNYKYHVYYDETSNGLGIEKSFQMYPTLQ